MIDCFAQNVDLQLIMVIFARKLEGTGSLTSSEVNTKATFAFSEAMILAFNKNLLVIRFSGTECAKRMW